MWRASSRLFSRSSGWVISLNVFVRSSGSVYPKASQIARLTWSKLPSRPTRADDVQQALIDREIDSFLVEQRQPVARVLLHVLEKGLGFRQLLRGRLLSGQVAARRQIKDVAAQVQPRDGLVGRHRGPVLPQ